MGHYFILDREATSAVTIQEALEEQGHSAEIFQDPLKALTALVEFGADVLILDLGIAAVDERQLVGTFRGVPETRSLPIIGLADEMSSEHTVEMLRLGLSDVLSRQLPLEELVARLSLSGGRPTADLPMLQGRLAGRQLLDFLEYLRHMGKSGVLQVTATGGAGRIEIDRGAVAAARFGHLRAQAAVLAMLDQDSGRFRLEEATAQPDSRPPDTVEMHTILLRAAWLADKLAELKEWVPSSGQEFELVAKPAPGDLSESAGSLPIATILEKAEANGSVRLHDLRREVDAAPQELRLSLAMLYRLGSLGLCSLGAVPSTKELKSDLGVEFSILDLFQRARAKGHRSDELTLLLVAEADVWPSLRSIFLKLRGEPFDDLAQQIQDDDRGSVTAQTDAGLLTFHLRMLGSTGLGELGTLIPESDGVLLWLGAATDKDLMFELADRVPPSQNAVRGVIVAADAATIEWSRQELTCRPEWILGKRPPARLSSLLRCFYSRAYVD